MIIPIDDAQRIRGTDTCWQHEELKIAQSGKKIGEETWAALGYYSSLSQALSAACGREIRLHPAATILGAIEAAERLTAKYTKIFEGAVE